MKHFLHVIAALFFLTASFHAQVFDWTFSNPGQSGIGLITDSQQNIYALSSGVGGSYGPFTFTSSSQTLAKHDTSGNVIWVSWIKAANCSDISIDRFDNIYVVGSCGNAIFASANNTIQVTQLGNMDSFLAKYDSNGNILWVKTSGTPYSGDSFKVIKTDAFGNSYVCGREDYYNGNVGYAVSNFIIAKYDTQGNLLWTKDSNWRGGANPAGIDIDKFGNCYIGGGFSDSAFFENTVLTTNTYGTIFFAKYNSAGNLLWVKKIGTSYDECYNLNYDKKNGIYLTGRHSAGSNFSGVTLTPKGMYIAKYDTSGSILWAHHENAVAGVRIVSDTTSCYVTGWFKNTATFGVGNNAHGVQSNKWNRDLFVVKYDGAGNVQWAIAPGGNNTDMNQVMAITADNSKNIFITGMYSGITTFGNTTLTQTSGIFLTKIKDQPNTIITGLPGKTHNASIILYPTPTNGLFNLSCEGLSEGDVQVRIINNLGETLYFEDQKQPAGRYSKVFDLSSLPKGIYFVEVRTNENRYVKKVVLE